MLAGSSGLHLYLYALYNLVSVLTITQPTSIVIYLTYMAIASLFFGIFNGTIGFYAAMAFVRKIYSSIKIVCSCSSTTAPVEG